MDRQSRSRHGIAPPTDSQDSRTLTASRTQTLPPTDSSEPYTESTAWQVNSQTETQLLRDLDIEQSPQGTPHQTCYGGKATKALLQQHYSASKGDWPLPRDTIISPTMTSRCGLHFGMAK